MPRNLERRLDVADFGTPVVTVDTFHQGGNTRMVIEPKGLWEHSAYQTDNRFIIEVKPIQEDPNKLTQGTRGGYKGEKLSLNFQNIDVRAVLQVIADFTGLNIITSDTVQGSLTLRLKDMPWDQALDIILQTKGLDMRKNGNVVLIAPREELALKEKQQLESPAQICDLEPLQTELFQLNYAKARTSSTSCPTSRDAAAMRAAGTVVPVAARRRDGRPAHQHPVRQDTPSRLEEVRRIIRQIDTSVRQVLIEARIVIAERQVQPHARRALRPADGLHFRPSAAWRVALDQPGQSASRWCGPRAPLPRYADADAVRTGVGVDRLSGLFGSHQMNLNLPVANAAGPRSR